MFKRARNSLKAAYKNLEISQTTKAITTATNINPVHTPALKILPKNSHELRETSKKLSNK